MMAIFESRSALIDLSGMCRLCLESSQSNLDIFGSYEDKCEMSVQSLVWKLFNFWVRPEDGLPNIICLDCFQKIYKFHLYSSKVKDNQIKIQQLATNNSQKSFHILRNTEEKSVDNLHSFQPSELQPVETDLEQFGTFSEAHIPRNDPWQFLSDESSSFGQVDSVSNCVPLPPPAPPPPPPLPPLPSLPAPSLHSLTTTNLHPDSVINPANNLVEIKVEVDPLMVEQLSIVQSPRDPKRSGAESRLNSRSMNTRSKSIKKAINTSQRLKPKDKLIKLENIEDVEEIVNEPDENISSSDNDSNTNSDSNEPIKKIGSRNLDRKQNWTERSKQRSKLTEQLAEFYKFKCLECLDETRFPTYHQLNLHSKKHHGVKGYVICCNLKLQDKNVIKSHMMKHLSPGIFQCQECGKELANKESLENHLVKHLPEEKRPFKCGQCGRGFPSKGGLTAHEKSHLPDDERMRYVCDVCGKRFPYQTSLNSHKKYVHLNLRTVMCHICPKTFVDKASLNSHIHTHLTNERVQCAECGKWFKNQINLRAHMKTHEGLTFSCPKCTKLFSTKHRLGEHVRGHTDARPHQCSICSKSFKVRAGLKTHLVQHTGEKPYQCPYCPRTFASSGNFSTHKKRMHGSLKPPLINDYNNVIQLGMHNIDQEVSRQFVSLPQCQGGS